MNYKDIFQEKVNEIEKLRKILSKDEFQSVMLEHYLKLEAQHQLLKQKYGK